MSRPISRLETLASLKYANIDGALATAFATLVTGTFLVGFVKYLGGSDAWVNLLAALPSLFGVLQVPGAIWGRGFTSYKRFVLPGGLAWRIFHWPLILLPLVALHADAKLLILAVCVSIASACVLIVNPIYNDWLAELVPPSSRGWFFGRRQILATAAGATVGILGGVALDAFKDSGHEATGYSVIFGCGALFAVASLTVFLRMHDLPREHPVRQSLRQGLSAMLVPVRDKNFRAVLIFLSVLVAGQAVAGNLFSAFALESLKMPFKILTLAGAMHALGIVAFTRIWGYLADKYGNRPVLFVLVVGITLTPLMWLFCYPGHDVANAWILVPGHIFSGAMWGGVMLCQFNILLATASEEDRANYIGVGLAVQALVGGVSPLIGGELMAHFRTLWPPEVAYKVLFGVAMGARFVAVLPLIPVRERGSVRLRETLRHLLKVTPKGYQALRSLSKSETPIHREQAIFKAAEQGMSLALDEIIDALHDPSPAVRRQAAKGLAQLRDVRAVPALIHQLDDHPDLVEEETMEALGELADETAVEPLVKYLHSPRALTRRAAAKALGRIGSPLATQALVASAADPTDPDLRRACLQALRLLGAKEAASVFADAILDPYPSNRIAAAEAVSELELKECLDSVRQSLRQFSDEAESEVAYALGAIGEQEDLPAILEHAERCVSIITRRRCLLGAARMLGVEPEVYRLFLLEGFARDTALLETLRPEIRKNKRIQVALDRFASGDEAGALKAMAKAAPSPWLDMFAAEPVREAFLVVAARLAKGYGVST